MSDAITPFRLDIPQSELDDLHLRLERTRWPDAEPVHDWSQGAPLNRVRSLCDHWLQHYDWRSCEAKLNALGQFRTNIYGIDIHFIHAKSPHPDALPLLLTHGWPGSVIEFMKVVGPLTDPTSHGGSPSDAFHVIIPSLPGYGFSGKPRETGWNVKRIADAWIILMRRLGYSRWVAQGGDWGSAVATAIGARAPAGCAAIHVNMCYVEPSAEHLADPTEEESEALGKMQHYADWGSGYAKQQSTRPQTLGYGLADSPAGQAAWIYEKLFAWTDNQGAPEDVLSLDEILDNIMMYWLTNSAASSARLYW